MRRRARSSSSKRKAEATADTGEELRRLGSLRVRLALDVVEAGFKSLAMKCHPDTGGSAETMATLLQVRAELNQIIEEFYE